MDGEAVEARDVHMALHVAAAEKMQREGGQAGHGEGDPGRLWRPQPSEMRDAVESGTASAGSHDDAGGVEELSRAVSAGTQPAPGAEPAPGAAHFQRRARPEHTRRRAQSVAGPSREGHATLIMSAPDGEAQAYHMMPTPPPMTPMSGIPDTPITASGLPDPLDEAPLRGAQRWQFITRFKVIRPRRAERATAFEAVADAIVETARELFVRLRAKRARELAETQATRRREAEEEERRRREEVMLRSRMLSELWRQSLHDLEQDLHHETLRQNTMSHIDVDNLTAAGHHVTRRGRGPTTILDQLRCLSPDVKQNEQQSRQVAGKEDLPQDNENSEKLPHMIDAVCGDENAEKLPHATDAVLCTPEESANETTSRPAKESGEIAPDEIAPEMEATIKQPPSDQDVTRHPDPVPTHVHAESVSGQAIKEPDLHQSAGSSQQGEAESRSERLNDETVMTERGGQESLDKFRHSQYTRTQQRTREVWQEQILEEERGRHDKTAKDDRVVAELAIARRRKCHLQALADSENRHRVLVRTARFMLPVREPVEPEIAQEQLTQKRELEYDFECKHGTGRPRCSAGSALLPHFAIPMSSRPRDIVDQSEAQLKHYVSKRSIPSTPPHWGKVHEPYVTRGHRKCDESLQRIRNVFQKIFSNVAEAFVFCDSYRVGYIELPSMKARLLTLGLTARPEDVHGLDMERVFLLATGKATAAMEFSHFCRQFTWEFPLTVEQERAWLKHRQASAREMSANERAEFYDKDLQSLARPRPNGPEPLLDAVEELLLDPDLFEKFCVIEGHSALQSGSRRLSMDQREWSSLLVYLQFLPRSAMKQMSKSQKIGEHVKEDAEGGTEVNHPDPRVVSLQKRLLRKLTKKEAMEAFFSGDTSEEKDGEMNFREYCAACQIIARILVSGGEKKIIEEATKSGAEDGDVFNFEAWWKQYQEQEAVLADGETLDIAPSEAGEEEEDEEQEIAKSMEKIIWTLENKEQEDIISHGAKIVVELLVTGVEEKQNRDEMRLARRLEAEAQARERNVQHEVHACVERLLIELQFEHDQKLVAEVQAILQQEPGFFHWKLIHAVKSRLDVMQKARKFGLECHRKRRQSIRTERLASRAQERRKFLETNSGLASFAFNVFPVAH